MSATVKYADVALSRRLCPVVLRKPSKDASDIVTYELKEVVKKVGDGDDEFVIVKKCVESSRVSRQAWIRKDAGDVGIMNILEKVRRSGDVTLFNQTHNIFEPSGEVDSLGRPLAKVQDYTATPGSVSEALKAVKAGAASYAELKKVLGDVSYEKLANMTPEEIQAAVNSYVAAHTKKTEEEGGEK